MDSSKGTYVVTEAGDLVVKYSSGLLAITGTSKERIEIQEGSLLKTDEKGKLTKEERVK